MTIFPVLSIAHSAAKKTLKIAFYERGYAILGQHVEQIKEDPAVHSARRVKGEKQTRLFTNGSKSEILCTGKASKYITLAMRRLSHID